MRYIMRAATLVHMSFRQCEAPLEQCLVVDIGKRGYKKVKKNASN